MHLHRIHKLFIERTWWHPFHHVMFLYAKCPYFFTSSNASKISILGWWIVQITVLPVSTMFFAALITIAAALASKPDVGSSINIIDGLETSSTAIVSRLRCSVDKPLIPGMPTKESLIPSSSIVSRTSLTKS